MEYRVWDIVYTVEYGVLRVEYGVRSMEYTMEYTMEYGAYCGV